MALFISSVSVFAWISTIFAVSFLTFGSKYFEHFLRVMINKTTHKHIASLPKSKLIIIELIISKVHDFNISDECYILHIFMHYIMLRLMTM